MNNTAKQVLKTAAVSTLVVAGVIIVLLALMFVGLLFILDNVY